MTVDVDTLAAVDGEWRGAREIHERVGMWSHRSIRSALSRLAAQRKVEAREVTMQAGVRLEYRKVADV